MHSEQARRSHESSGFRLAERPCARIRCAAANHQPHPFRDHASRAGDRDRAQASANVWLSFTWLNEGIGARPRVGHEDGTIPAHVLALAEKLALLPAEKLAALAVLPELE